MEAVFSSAFLLCVMDLVCSHLLPDKTWLSTAYGVFDVMIRRKSPGAGLRKRELARLEKVLQTYSQRRWDKSPTMARFDTFALDTFLNTNLYEEVEGNPTDVDDIFSLGILGTSGGFVMSPAAMLGLAEGLILQGVMEDD